MATLEEWQAKLDQDFPVGAKFYRSDWIDSDGTPAFRRTTGLHLIDIQDGFPRMYLIDADDDEQGWVVRIMSYLPAKDFKGRAVTIKSGNEKWTVFDGLPDKLTGSAKWKAQREAERTNTSQTELS